MSAERILTDEMIAEIRAYFPRYPDRRAVTLPALHVVNRQLRHVPLQAVAEIAQLLELSPAEVQDTLSFYGYFKQDHPHGEMRALGLPLDQLQPCGAGSRFWITSASAWGSSRARRRRTAS